MRAVLHALDLETGHHPGLLLQRYSPDAGRTNDDAKAAQRATLLAHAQQSARNSSLVELYGDAFRRWARSFPPAGHRSTRLGTRHSSRLAIGLGTASVLEVGLRLHQTYGTPLIPGSALKGLAASFCHEAWGQARNLDVSEDVRGFRRGGRYHALIFGTTEDSGAIVFHDAWITPESLGEGALRPDVMTPHHPEWQLDKAAPTDFDSPVPVPFLSVSGTFDVRLSWSGPNAVTPAQTDAWTALAMELVVGALADRGIGGKTRSGYGRLERTTVAVGPIQRAVEPPKPGARVDARLRPDKTKSGGWTAMHLATQLTGPVVNTANVPTKHAAGDTVELVVAYANSRDIGFRYPAENTPPSHAPAGKPTKGSRR